MPLNGQAFRWAVRWACGCSWEALSEGLAEGDLFRMLRRTLVAWTRGMAS